MSPLCAWAQAQLTAPGGHLWASSALQRPPLSCAGSRRQEVAEDAVSARLSEAPSESGASLLQAAGADAGTGAKPVPVLSMGSLNTRAEPVSDPSPAPHPQGRIRALPSAWLSLPVGRARCPWGSPGSALAPGLPWPFSPSMAERKPFLSIFFICSLRWFLFRGWLTPRVRNVPFVPTIWHSGFGLCVVLSFSMLLVFILNPRWCVLKKVCFS